MWELCNLKPERKFISDASHCLHEIYGNVSHICAWFAENVIIPALKSLVRWTIISIPNTVVSIRYRSTIPHPKPLRPEVLWNLEWQAISYIYHTLCNISSRNLGQHAVITPNLYFLNEVNISKVKYEFLHWLWIVSCQFRLDRLGYQKCLHQNYKKKFWFLEHLHFWTMHEGMWTRIDSPITASTSNSRSQGSIAKGMMLEQSLENSVGF